MFPQRITLGIADEEKAKKLARQLRKLLGHTPFWKDNVRCASYRSWLYALTCIANDDTQRSICNLTGRDARDKAIPYQTPASQRISSWNSKLYAHNQRDELRALQLETLETLCAENQEAYRLLEQLRTMEYILEFKDPDRNNLYLSEEELQYLLNEASKRHPTKISVSQ